MAKNISRLSPCFCGRCCPNSSFSVPVLGDVSRCGQQLPVSHRQTDSSCCSLQATSSRLFCTSELLAGSRASHWDRRPVAEGASALLRDDFGFSASFADKCQEFTPLRYHCGTRVSSMTMSNKCATHVLNKGKSESCWSRRLRNTQVSPCERSVNCSVHACRETQGNTTKERT